MSAACATCKRNNKRNSPKDWYERANDKDLKDVSKKGDAYVANISALMPYARAYECPACGHILWMGPKTTDVMTPWEDYCEDCGLVFEEDWVRPIEIILKKVEEYSKCVK